MANEKKVLVLTSAEGHVSIAEAIASELASEYTVILRAYRPKIFDTYSLFSQFFPASIKIPYKIGEFESSILIARTFAQKQFGKLIRSYIHEAKPDAVISTYFLYDDIAAAECMRLHIPFYAVVTDPLTFHPISITTSSTRTLLFSEQTYNRAKEMDIPLHPHCEITGWFVRAQFAQTTKQTRTDYRKLLKLQEDVLTFTVCGGSEGTIMVLKILPALFYLRKKVQVVIICGANKKLYSAVMAFTKLYSFMIKKSSISIIPLQFVHNMHEYMRASDLVIGKAGPNLLFESVATRTPFFAVTHISGQEDGNLDIIKKSRLGTVQEDPFKAIKLLRYIIAHPVWLKKFDAPLKTMAEYNNQSGTKLLALLKEDVR